MTDSVRIKKTILQKYADIMPKGAGVLFFIQMFSTLAFSVLYSTLVLYATNKLKMNDTTATGMTATFVAFNYALHLLGGYLGGRYLSYRSLFCVGMILIAIGCVLISIPTINSLYWGLASFLTGAGLNVTCINCMLTQLFQPNDKRREAAFLWNYSGMNVGFFVGFSISGYFQLNGGYRELFLFSSVGSIIALLLTLSRWKSLSDIHTKVTNLIATEKKLANMKGIGLIVVLLLALRWILENSNFSNNLIMSVGVFMGLVITYLAIKQPSLEQSKKVWAFLILAMTSLVFWTLYQLAPMGLTLFIERNVDRHFLGFLIAPQWVQNINTIVIIIGGPLLSVLFTSLRERGIQLTIPVQFSLALLLIGSSFAILPIGIHFANAQGLANFNWILASYILQSVGELFISPIGYAMVGQLAPTHLQGLMMGTWMMITGVAATLSGYFSNMALGTSNSTDPLITNVSFSHTFGLLGWMAIGTGIVLLVLIPWVLRLTQEKQLFIQQNAVAAGNT
ncbi:MAG: peptide MFS transporter [Gammaproteobacteria bacterium]